MLHHPRSRQSKNLRHQASISSAAQRGSLELAQLALELPHPDLLARLEKTSSAAPCEKPAGSCVIVVSLCDDDSDEE
ncbi:MAG: hypothetical protein JNM40_23660 [Myxococcales bacterium]|nr:hypothetical protein [Myxococcales bacterium]